MDWPWTKNDQTPFFQDIIKILKYFLENFQLKSVQLTVFIYYKIEVLRQLHLRLVTCKKNHRFLYTVSSNSSASSSLPSMFIKWFLAKLWKRQIRQIRNEKNQCKFLDCQWKSFFFALDWHVSQIVLDCLIKPKKVADFNFCKIVLHDFSKNYKKHWS